MEGHIITNNLTAKISCSDKKIDLKRCRVHLVFSALFRKFYFLVGFITEGGMGLCAAAVLVVSLMR